MKIALNWLQRMRVFYTQMQSYRVIGWLQSKAEQLPPYRTDTMAVIANVSLKYFHDLTVVIILTICVAGMIMTGTILGVEQGANFVRIQTKGWAKDQRGPESDIYDVFDLRFPQVENGALFLTTNMIKSPVQTRFANNEQTAARCVGSDKTEQCKLSSDCAYPSYTKHGYLDEGTSCLKEGYCLVNAWCNQYRWLCRTTRISFMTQNECETNCAYCYAEISTDNDGNPSCDGHVSADSNGKSSKPFYICEQDENGDPHICYNRYKTNIGANDQFSRCIEIYETTNSSLVPQYNQFIMNGLEDWIITFDIFMKFSKYWMVRNIVNKYYQDVNVWNLSEILSKVNTTYEQIKNDGIIIAANGIFECTLFSSHCSASWQFSRLDENNEGFGLTHRLYIPGVSIFLNDVKSMESRYIFHMKGIRLLASVSSRMYVPDPMAALIAIGGVAGLLGISNVLTNFVMKFISTKHKLYQNHIELSYEDFVRQEKEQLKEAFDIAIAKHMKTLYTDEQQMKKALGVEKDDLSNRF
eukprot:237947_1